MISPPENIDMLATTEEEMKAQDLIDCGQIDQAISIYQRLEPQSDRVLHRLGLLYAGKKGDYQSAIIYFQQALQIQEKNGSDICETLTELGFAYQNLHEYDLALIHHHRALSLREFDDNVDRKLVANNLLGLANAYCGEHNISEALIYAQRALALNKSAMSDNDTQIATNLAILANIYHHAGDDAQALILANEALIVFERYLPSDSSAIVTLLNNIGTIQVSAGMFNDAQLTFIRMLHIYETILPKGHSKRITVENNIQQMMRMQEDTLADLFSRFSDILTRLLLL